jgi:hypothetical protein
MHFDSDQVLAIFSLSIPIVAMVGAFAVAITRIIAAQRQAELAQRERIAAIERGIDPSKLPPINGTAGLDAWSRYQSPHRRAQGLLIGGLVTFAVGVGTSVFLYGVDSNHKAWAMGLIPLLVGLALILGAVIIWPRGQGPAGPQPPAPPIS